MKTYLTGWLESLPRPEMIKGQPGVSRIPSSPRDHKLVNLDRKKLSCDDDAGRVPRQGAIRRGGLLIVIMGHGVNREGAGGTREKVAGRRSGALDFGFLSLQQQSLQEEKDFIHLWAACFRLGGCTPTEQHGYTEPAGAARHSKRGSAIPPEPHPGYQGLNHDQLRRIREPGSGLFLPENMPFIRHSYRWGKVLREVTSGGPADLVI
jgi:hypothetical protein